MGDKRPVSIGGQAVIEGVMLRGRRHWVLAVRKPDGEIAVERNTLNSFLERHRYFRMPLVRGLIGLVENLTLGMKSLTRSAEYQLSEEEGEDASLGVGGTLAVVIAVALVTVVFVAIPALMAKQLYPVMPAVGVNLLEGLGKMALFIGYILLISRMPDIKRVFQYHGAEHQMVHAFEHAGTANVANASQESPLHLRCGTSFLLLVMMTSIFFFSFLGKPPFLQRILYHLALIPLIAGVSYEIIKAAGKHGNSSLVRAIMSPGLMLQKLTTQPPDQGQLEVAEAAMLELLEAEGITSPEQTDASMP